MFVPRVLHSISISIGLLLLAGCGAGGTQGSGPGSPTGQGLVLTNFLQSSQDNVPISEVLRFEFSEAVDASTVTANSIQVRQGPDYGISAPGTYDTDGNVVLFMPRLPGDCALEGAGLRPDTRYRVVLLGAPEEYAIRNTVGQPLSATLSREFQTLRDDDPEVLRDQIPGDRPVILSTTPEDGAAAVPLAGDNEILIQFSESLDPCSVSRASVYCHVYEVGDPDTRIAAPNGHRSGFSPVEDGATSPYTWGAANAVTALGVPQRIPTAVELVQTFDSTRIIARPLAGEFPENSLVVVDLSAGILDFGGNPLTRTTFAFTTENLEARTSTTEIRFDGTTPIDDLLTSADVNTARAPGRAQGFLRFSGDGDNGDDGVSPAYPIGSSTCEYRPNEGSKAVFDPPTNTILDTGSTRCGCPNLTDGSTAVVWEFESFRIRPGVTVSVVGVNPAILLVQNEVVIEGGGLLRLRGGGGQRGGVNTAGAGGPGVAGGGSGGGGGLEGSPGNYGAHGLVGYGSHDYGTGAEAGGLGAGRGGVDATYLRGPLLANQLGNSGGGGGGGHASRGADGQSTTGTENPFAAVPDSVGGDAYAPGSDGERMLLPTAGSGGGGSGSNHATDQTATSYTAGGSGGGGGGGFIDITCGGAVRIQGTIDASGGRGESGAVDTYGYGASGGAGGGSGGGIRILTPADIDVTDGALLAGGGPGGAGITQSGNGWATPSGPENAGGAGSNGRIVLEDGDSVITGLATANVVPAEGQDGFYRNSFDSARFALSGRVTRAVTGLVLVGTLGDSAFEVPAAKHFDVGAPRFGSPPAGETAVLVEIQGYPLLPDGSAGTPGTGWYTVGHFRSTGASDQMTWVPGSNPPDLAVSSDNVGVGIHHVDDSGYVQARFTFVVAHAAGAYEPGPFAESWRLQYQHDK